MISGQFLSYAKLSEVGGGYLCFRFRYLTRPPLRFLLRFLCMGAFLAMRIEVRQTLEALYILKPITVFLLHSRSLESLSQATKLAVFFFFLAFCAIPAARNKSKSWFFVFD